MKYYYLSGIDKLGPYNVDEILSRNLSKETMIYREDKAKWVQLSEFEELNTPMISLVDSSKNITHENTEQKISIKYKKIIFTFVFVFLAIIGYFVYQLFSLSEESARETSNRYFNMLTMKNINNDELEKLYPSSSLIGERLVFNNICIINNISRNSEGDFEVFASYQPDDKNSYPIYLVIGRDNNKTIIKSSKGVNYAYYNKLLEYGKKKGCLMGNEDDIKMGLLISGKNLDNELEAKTDLELQSIYDNLEVKSNLRQEYGYITGNVTIINKTGINFDFFDLTCRIDFYDRNGQITNSEKVISINGVNSNSSVSGSVYSSVSNSVKYKVVPIINSESFQFRNKVKEKIIEETVFGCY
jgi:hypothetical protein